MSINPQFFEQKREPKRGVEPASFRLPGQMRKKRRRFLYLLVPSTAQGHLRALGANKKKEAKKKKEKKERKKKKKKKKE